MEIRPKDLERFKSRKSGVPAPVEPRLSPEAEVELLTRRGTSDPTLAARQERARAVMLSVGVLSDDDAVLLSLLTVKRALPIRHPNERLSARQRLVSVGRRLDPPPAVAKLMRRHGIEPGDGDGFASALFPEGHSVSAFSENWPAGGGHGTLGHQGT